ncbi:MAG: hypothetical protein ACFFEY_18085 [Candidatus Thorarchaeota archaeon]
MNFIKRINNLFIRLRSIKLKYTKRNGQKKAIIDLKTKSTDNMKKYKKNRSGLYSYENFGGFKFYKSPIINDEKERERIFHQISKKLDELN